MAGKGRILIRNFFILLCLFAFSQSTKSQFDSKQIPEQQKDEIEEYKKSAEKYNKENKANEAANYFNKIAYIYWMNGFSEEAIDYFTKSLEQNQQIKNLNGMKSIYTNIGGIYSDEEEYDKALDYFQKSLKIRKQLQNKKEISAGMLNVAVALSELKQYKESNAYLEQALSMAQEDNDFKQMRSCYGILSENYEKMGDAEKSLEYFNFYSSFEKRIQKEALSKTVKESKKEMDELKSRTMQAETEKEKKVRELEKTTGFLKEVEKASRGQQIVIDLLNKEKELDKARLRNFTITLYSTISGVLLLTVLAFVLYRGYKQKKKANALLAEQNSEILEQQKEIKSKNLNITNSINYAQRIQQAMMPETESLSKFLPESFILLKPRDIVSGDFYWFSDTNLSSVISNAHNGNGEESRKKRKVDMNKFIISAIDCTGHGVPGAFMSMIGFNLINEIISQGIVEPDQILNTLHKGIRNALKQDTTENRDGMDMAICLVRRDEKIVEFAGAKNPLVFVKNDQLYEVKGDKISIGGFQRPGMEMDFTKHTVRITQPTTFYIFSDGFADQIGGDDGRKFLSKNFKKLLVEISREPLNMQKDLLEEAIMNWKGDKYKQVDDILVMGFRC